MVILLTGTVSVAQRDAERRQRAENLLFAAYFRVTHEMPRRNDRQVLLQLGPVMQGAWSNWVAKEVRAG